MDDHTGNIHPLHVTGGVKETFPGEVLPRISRREVLVGGALSLATLLFGIEACDTTPTPSPQATLNLSFVYSTEKHDWLGEVNGVIAAFNNSKKTTSQGKVIQIVPPENGSFDDGSFDAVTEIIEGHIHPAIWSPASDLEWKRLDYRWQNQKDHNGQTIVEHSSDLYPTSLVQSPLVFAIWKDRADALLSRYSTINWENLYGALSQADGWSAFGHPEWKRILLGQTHPDLSNSGLWAIILMAYTYTSNGEISLDQANSTDLWKYINVFERAVNGFGLSSGTYFVEDVIKQKPSAHAITITYENLILSDQKLAQQNQGESLQIFYPDLISMNRHPFVTLAADWVSPEQREAAKIFRDFLLEKQQQVQALQYGFRPADPSIQLTDSKIPNNKFKQFSQLSPLHGININDPIAPIPSGDVIEALIGQWKLHWHDPS